MNILGVIPARYASTRFPGKPLALIGDKPMIQHVWERASEALGRDQVVVATDDERIQSAATAFGARVEMTRSDHESGTDRVSEVAERLPSDIVVNIQGDEPLIDPKAIQGALALVESGAFPMATCATPFLSYEEFANDSSVKVLVNADRRALYFSRQAVPFSGDLPTLRHVGLYVYSKEALRKFRSLPPCLWERSESLEQLRAMVGGIPIGVFTAEFVSISVDHPSDIDRITLQKR